MTLEEERNLSFYTTVAALNEERGILLVQHSVSRRIFVRKTLEVYDRRVFQYLKEHPVADTPRIYELAEDKGRLIVIEEYINGTALQEILEADGTLPPERAREIILKIGRILQDLHGAEPPIIHRDIKPSNVLLGDDGRVVLIDMNAAKNYRSGPARDTRLIGTHGYAAPEQYGFGVSDVRTDIYALGVLMNVMLTGQLPSVGLASDAEGEWVSRCVQMDPKDRFTSMEMALRALDPSQGERIPEPEGSEEYLKSYLPPGFRTRAAGKMILASIGYFILAALPFVSEFSEEVGTQWAYRFMFLITFFMAAFISGNYRNILGRLHISYIENSWLRWITIFFLDTGVICFGIILIMLVDIYLQ